MRSRGLLILTLVALLVPGATLARWFRAPDTTVEFLAIPDLPAEIGPWRAVEQRRLDADVFAIIEPDSYLMQLYTAPGRTPIWVYLGVYAGRASYAKGAHDPEICYPAQGWEILRSQTFDVPLGDSGTLRTKLLEAHLGSVKEAVLYWFQPAQRWPAPAAGEQLMRVVDAVRGRPQYAFVRLSGPSDVSGDAARDLAEFAATVAAPIRSFVEAGRSGREIVPDAPEGPRDRVPDF